MNIDPSFAWLWLLLLGAVHGINPAMGWLFAVALGLQEQSGRAVWRALLPLAFGHALAIGAAVGLALLVGMVVPLRYLKWLVAAALLGLGVYRLYRHRHPRWGGMQVGMRDLAIWSLLMASAHGAGLMVLPFVVQEEPAMVQALHASPAEAMTPADGAVHVHNAYTVGSDGGGHAAHARLAGAGSGAIGGLAATLVHTASYLFVTGLIALLVYWKLGLQLLRSAWINLDLIWAGALIVTGLLTPLL